MVMGVDRKALKSSKGAYFPMGYLHSIHVVY